MFFSLLLSALALDPFPFLFLVWLFLMASDRGWFWNIDTTVIYRAYTEDPFSMFDCFERVRCTFFHSLRSLLFQMAHRHHIFQKIQWVFTFFNWYAGSGITIFSCMQWESTPSPMMKNLGIFAGFSVFSLSPKGSGFFFSFVHLLLSPYDICTVLLSVYCLLFI